MTTSLSTLPITKSWTDLVWVNNHFMLLAGPYYSTTETTYAVSADGRNWELRNFPVGGGWQCVGYNGSIYCVLGWGGKVLISTDCINWDYYTPINKPNNPSTIVNRDNLFCCYGNFSTPAVSTDGINWTSGTIESSVFSNLLVHDNKFYLSGPKVYSSSDGLTWTALTTSQINPSNSQVLRYGNGLFCSLGAEVQGKYYYTSPDAINWTNRSANLPYVSNWSDIIYNGTMFVMISSNDSAEAATSLDGINWTGQYLPTGAYWNYLAWNGTVFLAATSNSNKLALSPDGTWADYELDPEFWMNFHMQSETRQL